MSDPKDKDLLTDELRDQSVRCLDHLEKFLLVNPDIDPSIFASVLLAAQIKILKCTHCSKEEFYNNMVEIVTAYRDCWDEV